MNHGKTMHPLILLSSCQVNYFRGWVLVYSGGGFLSYGEQQIELLSLILNFHSSEISWFCSKLMSAELWIVLSVEYMSHSRLFLDFLSEGVSVIFIKNLVFEIEWNGMEQSRMLGMAGREKNGWEMLFDYSGHCIVWRPVENSNNVSERWIVMFSEVAIQYSD